MDFTDPSDIGALVGIISLLLTIFAWVIRRWIRDQMETLIIPHLKNDEVSVAKYAHEARDAAQSAGDSSLRAERASLAAESAAVKAAASADRTEAAVKQLLDRK